MLLREKLQIGLAVVGLGLAGMGLGFIGFGAEQRAIRPPNHGLGFWKEHGLSVEAGRRTGPWLIGVGIVSLAAAYVIREK
jgi:hypothetical protein